MSKRVGGVFSVRVSVLIPCLGCAFLAAPAVAQDVLTYHNDIARTGQNLFESTLTPSKVNSTTFGKLFTVTVDGAVDAQVLYASSVALSAKSTHDLLIVATEHDSVYAFDANTGTPIWQITTLPAGETPSDTRSCGQVSPEIGITAAPVIDRTRGPNGAIYLLAMSKNASGTYFQRLHALDLATGAELFGGPQDIQATYPGTGDNSSGGVVVFDPKQYKARSGLLLLNGIVYIAWASHCDIRPYTGWIMGYNESTLQQASVVNVTPNGNEGAIWMSQGGLAADGSSNIYVLDGNGDFDTVLNGSGFPTNGDFGNAFLKISTSGGLSVADYFEMSNEQTENSHDTDLGSGGVLVLPDMTDASNHTRHLAVGAGKDGNLYLVDRDSMGKFTSGSNNIYQELAGALPGGVWAGPAYFNNHLYYASTGQPIFSFSFSNARLSSSAVAQTSTVFASSVTPSVSANGSSNGIVWAAENVNPGVLHAYDAGTLVELYNSNQASGNRDHFGAGNKFVTPTISHGKVYVATRTGVGAFGLLNISVPNVAGMTETAAAAAIAGAGLTLGPVTTASSASVAPGNVISQTPSSGTPVSEGSAVSLVVSGSQPISMNPASGALGRQSFTFDAQDANGAGSIQYVQFLFSKSGVNALNACYVSYDPVANAFYLLSDDTTQWYGVLGGSSATTGNAQCEIHGATSGSSSSGSDLMVNLDVSFRSHFAGTKTVYEYSGDTLGHGSGWVSVGTWSDSGDPNIIEITSVSPLPSTGLTQTLTATLTDGATAISFAQLVINSTLNGVNACFIHYDRASNVFFLLNDAGTGWDGLYAGSATQVSNNQCTVQGVGSGGSSSGSPGSTLTITYNLEFAAGFSGTNQVYMQAADGSGNLEVWHNFGTDTP